MKSGKLTGGLYIEDDDVKKPDQYQSLDANRKRGNFEKDLDDMLFGGGFGAPPPRRRQPSQNKPADVSKQTVQPSTVVQPSSTNTTVPVTNQTKTDQTKPVNKNQPAKPNVPSKPSNDLNKSTDSGKNVTTSQVQNNIAINITGAKVTINTASKSVITNTKKEPSILVPSGEGDNKAPTINTIPIESQPVLPPSKKVDNYVNPSKPIEKPQEKPEQKPQPKKVSPPKKTQVQQKKPEPQVNIPSQPTQYEEPVIIDVLHPFNYKNSFNKPGNLRKLKKIAEDFKFADENASLHTAVDAVRPFQTDRNRQKKLNDFDFQDYQFPSSSISLGGSYKDKTSVWKKQHELAKTASFGKYIDPNDINPGILSNPHFVSTVSGLAELEANTKRLIQDQKFNTNGFYLIRLFVNSVWRYIAVEATLPFIDGEHAGIVSNPDNQFQLSAALIEKAYAKVFGGYDTFSKVQPRQNYLRDLTGAPVKKYSVQNPDLVNIIKKAISSGQLVLVVPNEKISALGLNPNFSYPLINFTNKGGMELRNSFGTLEQRSKLSFRPEGTFDLGPAQVKDLLSYILVTNIQTSNSTTTIQSKHRHGFYSSYNFKVTKETRGFLTVSQWDERLFPSNSGYEYSPAHILLHRREEDESATFVNAAFSLKSRNLDLEVNLTPGSYTVFVSVNWKQSQYAYNLNFYGSERVDFERVYTSKIPNFISKSLQTINVQHGKKTDLNKNSSQYFHYHPQSNLVILTIENTTDRNTTVTADLSKVKFDHLTLITSHNNEQDYSNKIGSQIDEYKQIPLTDKRWSVSLQGKHRFTWVLASDQAYNEGNPKSWGFN